METKEHNKCTNRNKPTDTENMLIDARRGGVLGDGVKKGKAIKRYKW